MDSLRRTPRRAPASAIRRGGQLARLREVTTTDVAEFNRLVRESDIPAIVPRVKEAKTGELAAAAGS